MFGLSALNRKLLRDLWNMKGQALAIGAVIAAGVTMYVTYLSTFDSLRRTRSEYFEQARLADVFVSLKRAPAFIEPRIAAIPGVEFVDTRVVADVSLDIPGLEEPATGRLISLPEHGRHALNNVLLRHGRWPDAQQSDEVLASEVFCEANGYVPGNRVAAVINGRRRLLTIVGIALSPEFVYAIRPGEMIPDARRFGVFWMGRPALAAAFNMEGSFNDVALALSRDAGADAVIERLDNLLEPYGGFGAIPQALQPSAWTLENELNQLQMFGFITPLIFLAVAAFILNVALTRALSLQRPQIAALKALGYANRAVAWHYIKWGLAIAAAGAAAGIVLGGYLGGGMIGLYNRYFRFPILDYRLSIDVAAYAMAGTLAVAALGAQSAVRRAVRVPPAEAMRPEAPARYGISVLERPWKRFRPALATRIVLRNLERQPMRSLSSIVGIAFAVAVLVVGFAFIDVMDALIERQFGQAMWQDATLSFVEPRSSDAVFAVRALPGVRDVEATRTVAVKLRSGPRSRTIAVTGLPAHPRLQRIVDSAGRPRTLPPEGLVLSAMLGDILGVRRGDTVRMEVLEGARPVQDVVVSDLVDDNFGLQAYMQVDALHRLLGEGRTVTGVSLTLDHAVLDRFYSKVKAVPAVAGVAVREVMLRNFRETMAENMNLTIGLNVLFAGVIAFGVVYNSARVSLSERSRELASLRVLGFTRSEISLILLGELAVLTVAALPVGAFIGYLLGQIIMLGFNNELYRLSFHVQPATVAWAFLTVLGAALVSGLLVRRRLDHLDLVAVLKERE